jgi:hypothetical protein
VVRAQEIFGLSEGSELVSRNITRYSLAFAFVFVETSGTSVLSRFAKSHFLERNVLEQYMLLSPLARRSPSVEAPCGPLMTSSGFTMQQRRREFATFWGPIGLLIVGFVIVRMLFNPPSEDTAALNLLDPNELAANPSAMKRLVRLSPAVAQALKAGKPVVALESTVVTHGG